MTHKNTNVKHLFIINPRSFSYKWAQENMIAGIHRFFKIAENNNYDIHVSRFPRDAAGFIPLYAKNLPENTTLRVYAVGGDGILFDCLNGVMRLENAELAAVPYGHTNSFIRGFGKNSKSLFRNIPRLCNAPTICLDVIRCEDNYALNYCSLGIEADAVLRAGRIREQLEKGSFFYRKWVSRGIYSFFYFVGGFISCLKRKLLHRQYEVYIDSENTTGSYWGVSFFNSPFYGGNMSPVKHAKPDDGILDIMFIHGSGLLSYFLYPFYMTGRYKMFPKIFSLKQGKKIYVRSNEPLIISMDDEIFYESELSVELLPAAVKFVDVSRSGYIGERK